MKDKHLKSSWLMHVCTYSYIDGWYQRYNEIIIMKFIEYERAKIKSVFYKVGSGFFLHYIIAVIYETLCMQRMNPGYLYRVVIQ